MDDRDPKKFCTNCKVTNEAHQLACWSCGSELNTKCAGPGCGIDLTIPGVGFHNHEGWVYCDDCFKDGWRRALPRREYPKRMSQLMYEAERYAAAYVRDNEDIDEATREAVYAQHLAYLINRELEETK